jgi:hypothetical protein
MKRSLAVAVAFTAVLLAMEARAAYVPGDPVADFTLPDAYGVPVSLYDYQGMVIFLTFWTDT